MDFEIRDRGKSFRFALIKKALRTLAEIGLKVTNHFSQPGTPSLEDLQLLPEKLMDRAMFDGAMTVEQNRKLVSPSDRRYWQWRSESNERRS